MHLKVEIDTFKDLPPDKFPVIVPESFIYAQIEKELEPEIRAKAELEGRLAQALKVLDDPNHPAILRYRQGVQDKEAIIQDRRKALHPKILEQLKERMQVTTGNNLAILKDKYNRLLLVKDLEEKNIEVLQKQLELFTKKTVTLEQKKDRIRAGCR